MCLDSRLVAGRLPLPKVAGSRGESEGRQLVRLADARSLSGLHRLPEIRHGRRRPERVVGPKAVCW